LAIRYIALDFVSVSTSIILRDSMIGGTNYLKTVAVEVDLHLDESWAGK
jgi:hypothetical protein